MQVHARARHFATALSNKNQNDTTINLYQLYNWQYHQIPHHGFGAQTKNHNHSNWSIRPNLEGQKNTKSEGRIYDEMAE